MMAPEMPVQFHNEKVGLKPLYHPARKGLIAVRSQARYPAPQAKNGGKTAMNGITMKFQFNAGQFAVLLVGIRYDWALEDYHHYFFIILRIISTALRNPSRSALSGVPSVACFPQI